MNSYRSVYLFLYQRYNMKKPRTDTRDTKKQYTISQGLVISMFLCACSIAILLFIWQSTYNDLRSNDASNNNTGGKSETAQESWDNTWDPLPSNWQQSYNWNSDSSDIEKTDTINTTAKPTDAHWNVWEIISVINAMSDKQLQIRQQRNNDQSFKPESIMPRYFQTFNWDINIMYK